MDTQTGRFLVTACVQLQRDIARCYTQPLQTSAQQCMQPCMKCCSSQPIPHYASRVYRQEPAVPSTSTSARLGHDALTATSVAVRVQPTLCMGLSYHTVPHPAANLPPKPDSTSPQCQNKVHLKEAQQERRTMLDWLVELTARGLG